MLSKIQKGNYINDMYEKEYLRFSNLNNFRSNQKDKTGRLDSKELNVSNNQIKTLKLISGNTEIDFNKITTKFNAQLTHHLTTPQTSCCSLYWIEMKANESLSPLDNRISDLGDKMLLIYNWEKFFEILDKSIEDLNLEYSRKKVIYYNPKTYNGDLTLHHKKIELGYQNEYRILIKPTQTDFINIPLPGLKDVSCVIKTKDYNKLNIEIE